MKKITGLMIVSMVLAFLLGGGVAYVLLQNNITKSNITTKSTITKIDNDKDYIYTANTYNIAGIDGGYKGEIPQINIKDEKIDEINNEIMSTFKKLMNTTSFKDTYNFDEEETLYSISYSSYVNTQNNVLSLGIDYQNIKGNKSINTSYMVYNIDLDTLDVITNKELIKKMNININEVKDGVKTAIDDFYESFGNTSNLKDNTEQILTYYVNTDTEDVSLPIFINEYGVLSVKLVLCPDYSYGYETPFYTIK